MRGMPCILEPGGSETLQVLPMTDLLPVAELMRQSARGLASAAAHHLAHSRPELAAIELPRTFGSVRSDLELRMTQLAEAVAVAEPGLFAEVCNWQRVAFDARNVPADYMAAGVAAMRSALQEELAPAVLSCVEPVLQAAQQALAKPSVRPDSPIEAYAPRIDVARRFLLATLEGRGEAALDVVRAELAAGIPIADLHDHVLIPVLQEVGHMWLLGESPIADEHLATQLVGRALDMIHMQLPPAADGAPKVLAFAVGGNQHDLGLRIVAQRLQLAGYEVTNLGRDLPASDLPWAMTDRDYDMLAVSVMLLQQLGAAREVVHERRRLLDGRPRILLGGPLFGRWPTLHEKLGADAGAGCADQAVAAADGLFGR